MEKIQDISDGKNIVKYTIVRSRRKTVGIKITGGGEVKVSAPLNVSENQIRDIVLKKMSWIVKKQEELKSLYRESNNENRFVDGESFYYLGSEYTLKIQKKLTLSSVTIQGNNIVVTAGGNSITGNEGENIRRILRSWYIKQFAEVIKDRIDKYAPQIGVCPVKVTVREQKTRWGSCSSKGNINLNWKLVMAPMKVVDYVIVHELCHMKEMNHSKSFWNIVSSILTDYDESRKWLKLNGHRLGI